LPFYVNGQENMEAKNINPKGEWFFGLEFGLNTITSIHPNHLNSIQGRILFCKTLECERKNKIF
jgi:hypothetical protein